MKPCERQESDFETACTWWRDLEGIWTPVGWKDHLFRFNVFWSGMIMAQPDRNRRTERYAGEGAQITFLPSIRGAVSAREAAFAVHDDGMVNQGWLDTAAPVLWSEWSNEGVLLRQYVFAHVPGGRDVDTGVEPLFAWVRLTIHDLCEGLPLEETHGFVVRVNAPHVNCRMTTCGNVLFDTERSAYPRPLRPDAPRYRKRSGWRLLEPDGRVRLGIAAGQECRVRFQEPAGGDADLDFHIQMNARKGEQVDLLLPMLPADRPVFDRELSLGYNGALREANRYWGRRPRTAARIRTPEHDINETVRHSLRFAEIISEKDPDTGKYCSLTGSFNYANLWATNIAARVTGLDMLGYHGAAAKYLEVFRDEQGTVVPPGDAYPPHPGYLSTPALYKSVDWLSDNGAILYAMAMHGLLSGDRAFIARFTDTIVRSCEWIRDARALKGHGGVAGVLPPAVATDRKTRIQAVWTIGWNYKGLTAAVRLLKRIDHPRAEEFAAEAREYRRVFVAAYRAKAARMPTWKDAKGRTRPLAPTALMGDDRAESRHGFFLDTGPLFLVYAGLLDANDDLMESARLWFREGPPTRFYRHDSSFAQLPVLSHEMSSCEPTFSWSVYHSHQLGDRPRFLEGMYSLFAGAMSRKTYVACESRHGITGLTCMGRIWILRLTVVDDEVRDDELHLLRLMPVAWLRKGQEAVFEKMPTIYGPVSVLTEVTKNGKTLNVTFTPRFRTAPRKVVLHHPSLSGLAKIKVNGRAVDMSRKTTALDSW